MRALAAALVNNGITAAALPSIRTSIARRMMNNVASEMNRKKLDGKVAVVTASTAGIGFAIAKRLGQDGARVVICSRKQANVDAALEVLKAERLGLEVMGVTCHVSQKEDRQKLLTKTQEHFGGIDILVNNAGTNPQYGDMLESTTEDNWDKIFDTNVKSAFFLTQETVPYMKNRGGGSVIFVASITAFNPMEWIPVYSVSKTSLVGMTKALAPSCAKRNVRVNCIAPGIIKTKFSKMLWENEDLGKTVLTSMPIKRFGDVDDCSGVVSFLASQDAAYITGETIVIAGGMPSRL
ncbi:dehydrogenase/reductase SDR family member 4-like [Tubulanus polymorphus]|uniref:dehydrogenase/reductase SDR family member 4-like n=1 Tax=Tubulanus polymorphus TaxID=672921 RepID=UPI003DA6C76B